jgi:hypothetical protein
MKQAPATDTSFLAPDITISRKWLLEQSDRLLWHEHNKRVREKNTAELFPDELSDKIGRSQEYVCGIIKNAISHAKSNKLKELNETRNMVT